MEYGGNSLDSKETAWHILKKYTRISGCTKGGYRGESCCSMPIRPRLDYTLLRDITIGDTQKLITSFERGHRTALCVGH